VEKEVPQINQRLSPAYFAEVNEARKAPFDMAWS
jgi:hypothetical protein